MYANSAYWNNSYIDFKDKKHPLFVGSCGTYHLFTKPKLPTHRPRGRLDFQLLYVASGKAHFYFRGVEEIVTAGHMVVYRPKEEQRYYYYGVDQTEVYWVHFTGNNVKNIMRQYGIMDSMHTIYTGTSLEYKRLFSQMIQEMQMHQTGYEEMLVLLLRQIFLMIQRQMGSRFRAKNTYLENEIEAAVKYFHQHYNVAINIDEYAASRGMSTSWFIRSFKEFTGSTPMQYILSIRITTAQNLLDTTDYTVTEISNIIGYENPLYFSRLFRKQNGISPSEFRKNIRLEEEDKNKNESME